MSQGGQSLAQEHNTVIPAGLKSTLTFDALSIHASPSEVFHGTFLIPFSIISSVFPEDKNQIVKRYVYSGTSGAASLQQFVEQNIYHRQGEVNV